VLTYKAKLQALDMLVNILQIFVNQILFLVYSYQTRFLYLEIQKYGSKSKIFDSLNLSKKRNSCTCNQSTKLDYQGVIIFFFFRRVD